MKAWIRSLVAIAWLSAACTASAPASPGPSSPATATPTQRASATTQPVEHVNVAFIRDQAVPDADEHALPALQGAQLGFQTAALADPDAAPIELVSVGIGEDPDALETILSDPSFVAAIVAPGVEVDVPAQLPFVSLSGLVSASDDGVPLVPPIEATARALAQSIPQAPCIVRDDPPPDPFSALVARRTGRPEDVIEPGDVADVVAERGCQTVVWGGGPDAAVDAVVALDRADARLVGGDRLLDHDFLAEASESAEGTRAFCPCADVSTSTAFAARRFIQDYQSEFGSAPAAYAVEGWDAAHLVLRAVRGSAPTRADVGAWLGGVAAHAGLARTYRFGTDGDLLDPGGTVRVYRVVGGRWVSEPA
ncbi:MAG TPA: hypothetical protein VJ774_03925 [Actinomycetota bacterium]|nr:hypothetical protein [Actinomycetota bacterium]